MKRHSSAERGAVVTLAGYFGMGNLGDEAVLSGLLVGLGDTSIQSIVMSGNPSLTTERRGVESIPRMNFGALRDALRRSRALALGGGSLLQDATSLRSLFYYLYLIRAGRQCGCRVALTGQGIGPLRRRISRLSVRLALDKAHAITVRDAESMRVLRDIGVRSPIEQTADLAWLMPRDTAAADRLLEERDIGIGTPIVIIAPRPWHTLRTDNLAARIATLAEELARRGFRAVGIPMDARVDVSLLRAVSDLTDAFTVVRGIPTPEVALGLIARATAVVAMRLHAALFAGMAGVPSLTIGYDPKVTALVALLGLPEPLSLDEVIEDGLLPEWDRFEPHIPSLANALTSITPQQTTLARRNIAIIEEACRTM